jgi:hypothetical protein
MQLSRAGIKDSGAIIYSGTMDVGELADLVTNPVTMLRQAGVDLPADKPVRVHVERTATEAR